MVLINATTLSKVVDAGELDQLLGGATSVVLAGRGRSFTQESLVQLYLCGITVVDHRWNSLRDSELQALVDALAQEECRLVDVQLCCNLISSAGATLLASALASAHSLTSVSLYGNRIGAEGATALALAIGPHPTITDLCLGRNDIQAAGMEGLAHGLMENTSLKVLSLSRNSIGDAGMEALALLLEQHPCLSRLELLSNKISSSGGRALGDALSRNSSLTELLLGENPLGNDGAISLARALEENSSLLCLELSKCDIGDDGMWALADSMGENESVTRLDVSYNHLEDVQAALELFAYSKSLISLNMEAQTAITSSRELVAARRIPFAALQESSDDLDSYDSSGSDYETDSNCSDSSAESDSEGGEESDSVHSGGAEPVLEHTVSDSVTGSECWSGSDKDDDGDDDLVAPVLVLDSEESFGSVGDERDDSSKEGASELTAESGREELSEEPLADDGGAEADEDAEYQEALRLYAEEDRRLQEEENFAPLRAEAEFHRSLLESDSDEEVEDLQDRWLGLREAIRRSRHDEAGTLDQQPGSVDVSSGEEEGDGPTVETEEQTPVEETIRNAADQLDGDDEPSRMAPFQCHTEDEPIQGQKQAVCESVSDHWSCSSEETTAAGDCLEFRPPTEQVLS